MVTKYASELLKRYRFLSEVSQYLASLAGMIKDRNEYIQRVRHGADSIFTNLGATRVNVGIPTDAQLDEALHTLRNKVLESHAAGDVISRNMYIDMRRNVKKQKNLLAANNIIDSRYRNRNSSSLYPHFDGATNLVHTENMCLPQYSLDYNDMFRTDVGFHEALEGLAKHRALHGVYTDYHGSLNKALKRYETMTINRYPYMSPKQIDNVLDRYIPSIFDPSRPDHKNVIADFLTSTPGKLFFLQPNRESLQYGRHHDMRVLKSERRMLDRTPYPNDPGLQKIYALRQAEGTYPYLDALARHNPNSAYVRNHPGNVNQLKRLANGDVQVDTPLLKGTLRRAW